MMMSRFRDWQPRRRVKTAVRPDKPLISPEIIFRQ
jgi:hypothetical protein